MYSRRGFTLIELMIVVAIIGILTAILISQVAHVIVVSKNKDRSRRGLPPLPDPTEQGTQTTSCIGTPVSIAADGMYIYKLYSSGCVEKVLK